jgi:hypothetical protein
MRNWCLLILLLLFSSHSAVGQYSLKTGSEPEIKAILYNKDNPRALIKYVGQKHHAVNGMRLDSEWTVEEIRRESVLFRKSSTNTFAEMVVFPEKRIKYHRNWSFTGQAISLWDAIELLAFGSGYQAIMHFQAGGSVIPAHHGENISTLLSKILPPGHRFALAGPVLIVLPVRPSSEDWAEVLQRMNKESAERLAIRFTGLNESGIVFSRGDDIQFVLRKIALGGKTPIQFPRDLHFPVYCAFRHVPFYQILKKIVYLNQCIIIEREDYLEISPWPRQILPYRPIADYPRIRVNPFEPQAGSGPKPPPLIHEHLRNHPLVYQGP